MKEYLLLFWNEPGDGQYQVSPEQMKSQMHDWQQWIGNIAAQGKLISTKPIEYSGVQVGHGPKLTSPVILEGKMLTGYMLCKAGSLTEVEGWAATCPILHSKNGLTEIREVSPFEI